MKTETVNKVIDNARSEWDQGAPANAEEYLSANPTIEAQKSILLELAYEEYCRRTSAGEQLDTEDFCNHFSVCKHSLRRRIEVHEFLHANADDWLSEQVWPEAGDNFKEFSLLHELGRGVDSRVFVAEQRSLSNRLVVLKFSFHGFREARLMTTLAHRNIVRVDAVEEDDISGLVAIRMPFVTTWTLMDLLDAAFATGAPPKRFADVLSEMQKDVGLPAPLLEPDPIDNFLAKCSYHDGVLYIMSQVAQALRHTHDRKLLHLDLKPSNILITGAGMPLVLDFNLSSSVESCRAIGGTLPYMPHEQLVSCTSKATQDNAVSELSDIYSLGVVTYQLLTGTLPFGTASNGLSTYELANLLLAEQKKGSPALQVEHKDVDSDPARVIERSLSFDITKRPKCVADVGNSFARSLRPSRRLARWCKAHRKALFLVVSLAFAILAVGGISIALQSPRHIRLSEQGKEYLSRAEWSKAVESFSLATELDPTNHVYWSCRGRANQALGKTAAAVRDYETAYELEPLQEYRARIGHCYAEQKEYDNAAAFLQKAVDEGLDTLGIHLCLGHSFAAKGDYEAAIRSYECAINKGPNSWRAQYGMSRAITSKATSTAGSVPESAVLRIERAAELNPSSWLVAMAATQVHYEFARTNGLADYENAIDHLERALLLGLPKSAAESFRALPALSENPRFQRLVDDYQPIADAPGRESLIVDPVLHAAE